MQKGERGRNRRWRSGTTDDSFPNLSTLTSTVSTPPPKKKKKQLKEAYTQCLADHAAGADACTPIAKAYLKCRMDR